MSEMKNIPKSIYLNIGEDINGIDNFDTLREVTWSETVIDNNDVEYFRKQSPKAMTSEEYETAYLTGQGALREMVEGYFNKILGKRERDPKAMIAEATIREIAPFLRRLINPRYDTDETNDYVNGSSDCIRALEAIQVWDEVCKQDKTIKGGGEDE